MKHFPSSPGRYKGLASRKLWALLVALSAAGLIWLLIRWHILATGFDQQITTLQPNQNYRPAKTLWDWLQLAGIPVALAFIAYLFQDATKKSEQRIALENQRNDILQKYVDAMSELILSAEWATAIKEFRDSGKRTNPQIVARARTQVALGALQSEPPDPRRRGQIIRFLAENGLLQVPDLATQALVDLYGTDLRGVDLARADLSNVDLKGVDLTGADLRWANLRGISENSVDTIDRRSVFGESQLYTTKFDPKWQLVSEIVNGTAFLRDLINRDFRDAFLSQAKLYNSTLRRADFRGANLARASLHDSDLRGADLRGAVLDLADLGKTRINWRTRLDSKWKLVWRLRCQKDRREDLLKGLGNADLSHAYLFYSWMKEARLDNADLTNADLEGATLEGATFTKNSTVLGTKFEEADLTRSNLDGCAIMMCNLKRAKLNGASLIGVHCDFSQLDGSDLTGAHLDKAEISNVTFIGANLTKADFAGVTFKENVDCAGANFRDAKISREQLATISNLSGAILPDGSTHP